jgi:O-antigen/teichoic acid export membrane protein
MIHNPITRNRKITKQWSSSKSNINIQTIQTARFRRLSKEGFWIILGQAMAVIGSVAGVRLLTELLDPVQYGRLALGMTVATLVNQSVFGPLSNGVTRFYAPAAEKGDLVGYLNAVRRLALSATGIIVLMILFAVPGLLLVGRTKWIAITIAALVFSILSGYNSFFNGIQNAARKRSIVAFHQGVEPWVRFLCAVGLLLLLATTGTMALIGYATAMALVLGSQFKFFQKTASKYTSGTNDERHWSRDIWKFSWPISLFGLFTWMQLASDRWALQIFATTKDVGLYAVLFQVGYYPMSMITGMALQFLAPILYQRAGDASDSRRNANVCKLSWYLTWLALCMTVATFLVTYLSHKLIFRVFVAREYASVSYLLPWMLLAGGVFASGQTIALNLMSQMKTQTMMAAKIVTALLGVTLNFAGSYWYGTTGIVAASVLFSTSYFFWMALLSKQEGIKNVCR